MAATITIELDQPITLKFTQAAKYRMSELGVFSDLQVEGKEFSAACKIIVACSEPYNPRLKPESVAELIGDNFAEVIEKIGEFLTEAQEPVGKGKKPTSKPGHSSDSKSD